MTVSRLTVVAKRAARRGAGRVGSIVSVRTAQPIAVLSYDDGPEPAGTDRILRSLAATGARATFFVLVSRVRLYPSLLRDIVDAGHEVALHGMDHRRLTTFSGAEAWRRTVDARAELEDRTGQPVRWLRPPYGALNLPAWRAVRRAGLAPVLWGPSSFDWKPLPDHERLAHLRRTAERGAIVLCHDGFADSRDGVDDGPAPDVDRGDLALRMVDVFGSLGLRCTSLSEALMHGTPVREARFRR